LGVSVFFAGKIDTIFPALQAADLRRLCFFFWLATPKEQEGERTLRMQVLMQVLFTCLQVELRLAGGFL